MLFVDLGEITAIIGVISALAKFMHWLISTMKSGLEALIQKETATLRLQIKQSDEKINELSTRMAGITRTVDEINRATVSAIKGGDRLRDELIATLEQERKKSLEEFERSRVVWENDFVGRLKTVLAQKKSG
jgi:hypothetical protein